MASDQLTILAPPCGVKGCTRDAAGWSITGREYRVCPDHNLDEWLAGMERAGYGADAARIRQRIRQEATRDA